MKDPAPAGFFMLVECLLLAVLGQSKYKCFANRVAVSKNKIFFNILEHITYHCKYAPQSKGSSAEGPNISSNGIGSSFRIS